MNHYLQQLYQSIVPLIVTFSTILRTHVHENGRAHFRFIAVFFLPKMPHPRSYSHFSRKKRSACRKCAKEDTFSSDNGIGKLFTRFFVSCSHIVLPCFHCKFRALSAIDICYHLILIRNHYRDFLSVSSLFEEFSFNFLSWFYSRFILLVNCSCSISFLEY